MPNIKTVRWRQGTDIKADPNKALEELEAIRLKNNGDLDPGAVVKKARQKKSVLHGEFIWDDAEAALEHRLDRARLIMRSVVVVREELPKEPMRLYEAVQVREEVPSSKRRNQCKRVYRTVEDIAQDPDAHAELMVRAMRELASFRDRYRHLSELSLVFQAIDESLAKHG